MTNESGRSERSVQTVVRPLQEFLGTEAAGGAMLVAAAVVALVWVNLPFGLSYERFWNASFDIHRGFVGLPDSLRAVVNDALMAVFFLVAGLEIKREILRGELSDRRSAMLPVAAALGGMVVPALIYLAFNAKGGGARGWAIPMATDIAFAVGVLALIGNRIPTSLRVFLLALAIVDDLGAIIVIALFYTDAVHLGWLAGAIAVFALMIAFGRWDVRQLAPYLAAGVIAWLCVYESGIHATVAGVVLGLLIPIGPGAVARLTTDESDIDLPVDARRAGGRASDDDDLFRLDDPVGEPRSPLDRLEEMLHPWASYVIVPLFALANAGVSLDAASLRNAASSHVALGVALGLMLGKPMGITLFAFVAVRQRWATLPSGVSWPQLTATSMIAGIGFTVSLFITGLAFDGQQRAVEAKTAILAASSAIAALGLVTLWFCSRGDTMTNSS